jgi:hypothetical protein
MDQPLDPGALRLGLIRRHGPDPGLQYPSVDRAAPLAVLALRLLPLEFVQVQLLLVCNNRPPSHEGAHRLLKLAEATMVGREKQQRVTKDPRLLPALG